MLFVFSIITTITKLFDSFFQKPFGFCCFIPAIDGYYNIKSQHRVPEK